MGIYKFIKIKGCTRSEGNRTGYFVHRLYGLPFSWAEFKSIGFRWLKERLNGWSIWYVTNEEDYHNAIRELNELKKTRIFDFMVHDA